MYSPWVLSAWVALKEKGIPFSVQKARSNERRAPDRGIPEEDFGGEGSGRLPSVIFGYQNHRNRGVPGRKISRRPNTPAYFRKRRGASKGSGNCLLAQKRFDRVEEIDVLRRHFSAREKRSAQ